MFLEGDGRSDAHFHTELNHPPTDAGLDSGLTRYLENAIRARSAWSSCSSRITL